MRVIQVVQQLRPGGLEVLTLNLLEHLPAEVHILSLEGTAEASLKHWPRLRAWRDRLHFLDKPEGLQPGILRKVIKRLRDLRPHAVHTHHIGPLLYGGLAARWAGVPVRLHTEHDVWHLCSRRERSLQALLLRLSRPQVVAVSDAIAATLQGYYPWLAPKVVHNGIDTRCFAPHDAMAARRALGIDESKRWIGCAARLEHVKGVDILLQALAALENPQLHLAVAGNGSQRQTLEKLANQLELQAQVRFLGHVDEMADFYNACDVYCQPSRHEGLPLAVLEALACNRPCVLTDAGSCKELGDIAGVRIVPTENPLALADALAAALGMAAIDSRSAIQSKYDVKHVTEVYFKLLEKAGNA